MSGLFGDGFSATAQKEQDFSKRTVDSDVYEAEIKMAFAGQSKGGARSVTLQLKLANGKDYSETVYVSNKEGKNVYVKDDKDYYLPGFLLINNIAIMATEKNLFDLAESVETRTVKLYDYDAKKEVATDVPAIIPLIGKKIMVAIIEKEEEKTALNTSTNKYEPTGEYRIKNEMVKVFNPETKQTAPEMRDEKEATVYANWVTEHKGKLKVAERAAAPANQSTAVAGKPSGLFGS